MRVDQSIIPLYHQFQDVWKTTLILCQHIYIYFLCARTLLQVLEIFHIGLETLLKDLYVYQQTRAGVLMNLCTPRLSEAYSKTHFVQF